MSKKRNRFSESFKAKVALEALKERKTTSQIATDFKVHPTQVTQWKKQLLSSASDLFCRGKRKLQGDTDELTAPLYEEIGRLKMDIKWLEKKL